MDKKLILKIISWVFIIIVIVDAITTVIGFTSGNLRKQMEATFEEGMTESGESYEEISQQVIDIFVYFSIGGTVIASLLKLYLGVKGINQANGKIKGKANIVWAKIIFYLSLVSVISGIMSITKGKQSISSFITSIVSLIVIYIYMTAAKEVVEEAEQK